MDRGGSVGVDAVGVGVNVGWDRVGPCPRPRPLARTEELVCPTRPGFECPPLPAFEDVGCCSWPKES